MSMGRMVFLCLTTSTTLQDLLRATRTSSFTTARNQQILRNLARRTMPSTGETSTGLGDIGIKTGDDNLASWRSRINTSIAKSRKIRGGNYVQIATVDPIANEPRCRTVVFRGFLEVIDSIPCDGKPCVMKMITDLRSSKVTEADKNAACEMVWWFAKSSEQYRIRGNLSFVGSGQFAMDEQLSSARLQQWGNLSDRAREQFFWQDPGLLYSCESAVPEGGRDQDGKVLSPPHNFLLMLLFPTHVDYLRLGDNYRQIDEIEDGAWTLRRVNP